RVASETPKNKRKIPRHKVYAPPKMIFAEVLGWWFSLFMFPYSLKLQST
ncbi:5117_t:CDS:1, partial [Dentiscutata heterogama]